MKFLVIGLGSMGKRRIRCLKALNFQDIVGFDPREDRRLESKEKYNIETLDDLAKVSSERFKAVIISTPPYVHDQYIAWCLERKIPCFVEASVIVDELPGLLQRSEQSKTPVVPSATMLFHAGVKEIFRLVQSGEYGKVTNFSYHAGQYLPDWHPWEKVSDYYVSHPATGGAREIVPFELTWLSKLLGLPKGAKGFAGRTMDVGAAIEDTYSFVLDYGNYFGMVTIDVVSRYAIRHLVLNMEKGHLVWNWDEPAVKVYSGEKKEWISYDIQETKAAEGYNKNISEQMYIDEISSFLKQVDTGKGYPTDLKYDIQILQLLNDIEKTAGISHG